MNHTGVCGTGPPRAARTNAESAVAGTWEEARVAPDAVVVIPSMLARLAATGSGTPDGSPGRHRDHARPTAATRSTPMAPACRAPNA
ncbi:hypothetical protein JCM9534A_82320 [Catenuloplanes indicus JCM 9534]